MSNGGVSIGITKTSAKNFSRFDNGSGVNSNFGDGDHLLSTDEFGMNPGAFNEIIFDDFNGAGIIAGGTQIVTNDIGTFVARISAFDINDVLLGTHTFNGIAKFGILDNSAVFIGISSTVPIHKLTISVDSANGAVIPPPIGDYSINQFDFTPAELKVLSAAEQLNNTAILLGDLVENNPGPVADKVEDALAGVAAALVELNETVPDLSAVLGTLEGVVGDIQAAVDDGLLSPVLGNDLMDQLTSVARQIAVNALQDAIDRDGDSDKIDEAIEALALGDGLLSSEVFKDAINKFKDAHSIAEGA